MKNKSLLLLLFITIVVCTAAAQPPTVYFREGLKYGFKDAKGKIIIPAIYDAAGDFSEGLARVNLGFTMSSNGKWGFIDTTGKLVIPIYMKGLTISRTAWPRQG